MEAVVERALEVILEVEEAVAAAVVTVIAAVGMWEVLARRFAEMPAVVEVVVRQE